MPRGLTAGQKTELDSTTLGAPVYCVRIRRKDGSFLRWSERNPTFNDGTPSQTYEARIRSISGFEFGPDEAGPITITLANVDGQITTLDRAESFAGERCEVLAYLPGIDSFYIPWSGWGDDVSELTAEYATLQAYPAVSNPHVQIPQRTIGIPCTHVFGHTASWVNFKDFEGAECPYQRVSTVGFVAALNGGINNSVTSIVGRWTAGLVSAGAKFKKSDVIKIDSEKMLITNSPADPDGNGDQTLTVTRAYQGTTAASHSDLATILFANCQYDTVACTRRGMYGNNTSDTYSGGSKKRNYFGGFPFVVGWQFGNFRSKSGERAKPLRLVFSGNESAYGRALPLVYGKVRIADPVLLLAKPEGDFLTTLWAVAEGVLATNTTNDDQATPGDAYVKVSGVEQIFVNGVSRHDPRPGFGIESYNGTQDQPEPASVFITGITDFSTNNLGFWGTARVIFRINTKNNPSVDVKGQSITGAFEVAFGRVVRVYTAAPSTFTRKATTNPAWVLMDVMTAKRAGGGLDHESRLNVQSFIDLASHCSATVTSTFDGSSVPRWSFNGILDTRQGYAEWIHRIAIGCYSLPPFMDKDGKLKVKALKSETLSGLPFFSSKNSTEANRNIIWNGNQSSLVKQRRSIAEIPNEIRVNYVDISDYAKVSLTVADREAQTDLGTKLGDNSRRAITKVVDLPGTSSLDEAARLATLLLRAGEFGQGGLSNNLKVTFKAFYRAVEDLEIGDVIEVEDDLLSAANGEQYFRVTYISHELLQVDDGGFVFAKEVEAVLHSNGIYDDTALTVSKYDRIDAPYPPDAEVPAVTGFSVAESGIFDANNKPSTRLTFTWTDPNPKDNFKSVALHVTNDDGGGSPVEGAWQYIGDLYNSGEIIDNYPVTGTIQHFCAVSRALSGHAMDVGTKLANGNFKYPRFSVLVDGMTDTLAAPGNPQIFLGSQLVTLKWDAYTGTNLKLFKAFHVYRNTVNDLGTATKIATLDGTLFIDASVDPSTTYYYWIKGLSILNVEGTATSALTATSSSSAGADTDVPTAPTIGTFLNYSSLNTNEYEWVVGIDKPGGAVNWSGVYLARLQVALDAGFTTPFDREFSITEKVTTRFRVNSPDTYYFRALVRNSFGESAWSSTLVRTTAIADAAQDTDLVAAPTVTMYIDTDTGKTYLSGTQFELEFSVPSQQAQSYWGYTIMVHSASTLPTATTDETGTGGAINAGENKLTDSGKAWTTNQWAGKDLVVFSTKRGGSPTWDYEGVIYIAPIISNTATEITFELPFNRITHTLTGCKYYIVTPGNHFYDKINLHAVITNEGITALSEQRSAKRKVTIEAGAPQMYAWVALNNLWGHGKVTGSPPNKTFLGYKSSQIRDSAIISAKVDTNAITETKISSSAVTTPKLNANAVTAAKADLTDIFAQTITASGTITGATLQTATSGGRVALDSTNGLRAFDTGGTLQTQIAISGSNAGKIFTTAVQAQGTLLGLGDSTLNVSLVLGSSAAQFAIGGTNRLLVNASGVQAQNAINFIVNNGNGLANASANASIALPSGAAELYGSSGIGLQADGADSGVNTGVLIQGDGSLRRVAFDNSDFGTGAKRYLYLV
jgi:hypothetical protein